MVALSASLRTTCVVDVTVILLRFKTANHCKILRTVALDQLNTDVGSAMAVSRIVIAIVDALGNAATDVAIEPVSDFTAATSADTVAPAGVPSFVLIALMFVLAVAKFVALANAVNPAPFEPMRDCKSSVSACTAAMSA